MQRKKRENSVVTHAVIQDADGKLAGIQWNVLGAGEPDAEGKATDGLITLMLDKVSRENKDYAMVHGFIQRITDAAAMVRDQKTGASATPFEKFEAMRELAEFYMQGGTQWRMPGGRGLGDGGMLVEALCRLKPEKERSVVHAWVKGLTDKQRKALVLDEKVSKVMNEIRVEQGKMIQVNTEELLKGLE